MKISACTITKNEAKHIGRSIESYREIADEIILVDSGSTDQTVPIAESLGASVYTRPWTGDFAAAKNYAIERASGDWILFLDADESFDAGGAKRAKELMLLAGQDEHIDAVSVKMKHLADEQGGVLMVYPIVRMFKNKRGVRYQSKVHEYLEKDGKSLHMLSSEDTLLLHTGYIRSAMPEKLGRNLTLLEETQGPPALQCALLLAKAECYSGLGRPEETLDCIGEIEKDGQLDTFLRASGKAPDIYKFKAEAMLALAGRFADGEIQTCIEEGIRRFPTHPEVMLLRARFLYERNQKAAAIEPIERALELDQVYKDHYINSFSAAKGKSYAMLGHLYTFYQNDMRKAGQNYEKALELSKRNPEALQGLLWSVKGMPVDLIRQRLERIYDTQSSEDISMIIEAGLFCGMREVFTTYFMYFAKKWPEKLGANQRLIHKVNLMKRDYQSLPDAGDPFWLIGGLAGHADWKERWKNIDKPGRKNLLLNAVAELIQAEDGKMLERILTEESLCGQMNIAEDLAKLFEWMRDYRHAQIYYREAGLYEEAERMVFLQNPL